MERGPSVVPVLFTSVHHPENAFLGSLKTGTVATMTASNTLVLLKRTSLVLLVISVVSLLCWISRLPTGYLHSWNQVTTLGMTQSITEGWSRILGPLDSVALLSWPHVHPGMSADELFRVYQEFPLYQTIVAMGWRLGAPRIIFAKVVTLAFAALLLLATYRLVTREREALFTGTVLYLASCFPFLYYAQATMSDTAMVACLALSFQLAVSCGACREHPKTMKESTAVSAVILFVLSTLFKSYSLVFLPALLFVLLPFSMASLPRYLLYSIVGAVPVLAWHLYGVVHGGHQEFLSHSLSSKLAMVMTPLFFTTLLKQLSRFFGILDGVLLAGVLLSPMRKEILRAVKTSRWFLPYSLSFFLFLVGTADKLGAHDYYFLLGVPLFAFLMAHAFQVVLHAVNSKPVFGWVLVVALVADLSHALYRLERATRPNPDVAQCADLIASLTPAHEYIAVLATNERYNSLHFFSGRRGFVLEDLPLKFYTEMGASRLVVDVPTNELATVLTKAHLGALPLLGELRELSDFKGTPRVCQVYSLQRPSPSSPTL